MTLLGYADSAKLAADVAAIEAAHAATDPPAYTDAQGRPLTPSHPLLARSPQAAQRRYLPAAVTFAGTAGGLLKTDAFAESVLGAVAVAARTKVEPPKPTKPTDEAAYLAALKALVPAVEPVIAGALIADVAEAKLDIKNGK